jgi:glycosyltransferase involved in cell wall biosynthesis
MKAARPKPETLGAFSGETAGVLVVARHYWPAPGAATVRLQALVSAFVRHGHDVTVITRPPAGERPVKGPSGERLEYVVGDTETGVGLVRVFRLLLFALGAWRRTRRIKPSIVISDPPPTSALASIGRRCARRVYYLADCWSEMLSEGGGRSGQLLSLGVRPLESYVLRQSDLVIAVRENLADVARGFGARTVVTAPYGTDLSTFVPAGPLWPDPWAGALPYFVYAGNYGVIQGATVFLDAAEALWRDGAEFGMVFMGYGSDSDQVEEFALRYPERFKSLEMQPAEVAAAAFRGCIGALASMRPVTAANQTRPAKALAALACGCPLIFAGEGAFVSEVNENNLGIATPWSPNSVANALDRMLAHSQAARTGGVGPMNRPHIVQYAAENFDISRTAKDLERLICERCGHE